MEFLQGRQARVCDRENSKIGQTLSATLEPYRDVIAAFSSEARLKDRAQLSRLWADIFPLVIPPTDEAGLGILILNSNAQSNFSFTNALGLVSVDDISVASRVMEQYPKSGWIIAIHHHVIEYPLAVKVFSERIGTALINGSWLIKRLKPFAHRTIVMHGHRHIDWIGRVGDLTIVSAPSPVMNADDYDSSHFYIHTVHLTATGTVQLATPQRVDVGGATAEVSG
jgi:hypothetical protein